MRLLFAQRSSVVLGPMFLLAAACGGSGENTTTAVGGMGGVSEAGGAGEGGVGANLFPVTSAGGMGGVGGVDPCAGSNCPPDQHCEDGMCVNNDCADLMCGPTEECQTTMGGGALCVDIGCTEDIECPADRFCNGTICEDDVCVPGESHCQGDDLYECNSNGSADVLLYTCAGAAAFNSTCVDDGMGHAYCGCEDDWDCPANTECDAGECSGTGQPPTCFLPPEPFSNATPVPEIIWGGTGYGVEDDGINDEKATLPELAPFEDSSQVVQTAVVANLDDDNGDGLIDERDFPEIIFSSFCGYFNGNGANIGTHDYRAQGTLRAIHGGGPNKGLNFFASHGSTVWVEGDALPDPMAFSCQDGILDPTASIAVGDLDYDGVPEIVTITEGQDDADGSNSGEVIVFSNLGVVLATSATVDFRGSNPAPSIANLDGAEYAEIVVGRHVFGLGDDGGGMLIFTNRWEGTEDDGTNGQGPSSCVANVTGDPRLEIVGGDTLYKFPVGPAAITLQSDCTGAEVGEEADWCTGILPVIWDGSTLGATEDEGFCAVVDIWGADPNTAPGPNNALDGKPEVVIISNDPNGAGNADDEGLIQILDGDTGALIYKEKHNVGRRGGPPNVDDFDGDGFPEVGTAGAIAYIVFDLQEPTADDGACPRWDTAPANDTLTVESANDPRTPPNNACIADIDCGDINTFACNEAIGECICLHNTWRRSTEDDSSRVTGSSVFDFNGDGRAEVVYNDECRFRVYDGLDGTVNFSEPSESRTRIEYPIVADVDNDGNAEIVFSTTNESGFCGENLDGSYNNGIEVWGDQNDFWVSARRIWNQHAYHVTNVTESGQIPLVEPENWLTYEGRQYNLYRSNPRTRGIAPDLSPTAMQVSSPDAVCGQLSDTIDITVQIENLGDLRVGPGVSIGFHGIWNAQVIDEPLYADMMMTPLTATLVNSLDPGGKIFVTVQYNVANNAQASLPDDIRVVVDEGDAERECNESNNELTEPVQAGNQEADLRVELGASSSTPTCPTVETTVFNDGSADASDVVVRYFAGDPKAGGTALHDETIPGVIAAGSSVMLDVNIPNFPQGIQVQIWAVVDPDDAVEECNDGNNDDDADNEQICGGVN